MARLPGAWLVLGGALLVLLGATAAPRPLPGLAVTARTARYVGAPRPVVVQDVTLPSGQHLWLDTDLCRTFAWYDTDDITPLSNPVATGSRWPVPDITVYRGYPSPYSDQQGGFWASDWGSQWQPHVQGLATTPTSATLTCDYATVDGNDAAHRYTAALTYTAADRPAGRGYSLQAVVTPPAAVTVDTWTQQTGLGGVGGDGSALVAWDFTGDGYGVRAMPYLQGVDNVHYDTAFWTILTHPQGTFVLEQPNLHDPHAFGGWVLSGEWDQGFTAAKPTAGTRSGNVLTTDPLVFLWKREPDRAIPQRYLDARYALLHDWAATLGLGPQHLPLAREGGGGGQVDFTALGDPTSYGGTGYGPLDWGARFWMLTEQTTMYEAVPDVLSPDLYWPNASDLPGLDPPVTGAYGTLAAWRDGLSLLRLLGLTGTYWSQWGYHNGCGAGEAGEVSRFDRQPRSYFFRQQSALVTGTGCDAQIDLTNPAAWAWMRDWSARYWLGDGLPGKFLDSSPQIPGVFTPAAPLALDFYTWYLRQGGYLMGETPQAFIGPLYWNQGSPYATAGREWGAPFAATGTRFRTCLGAAGAGLAACQVATAGQYARGVQADPASVHRLHVIGGASGEGGLDKLQDEQAQGAAHVAAVQAEALQFGALQDRYGLPDRVELIAPTQTDATPWPAELGAPLSATETTVWVSPGYQLPQAGTLQLDGERLRYTGQQTDDGLNSGVVLLQGVTRGVDGTPAAPHAAGATLTVPHDPLHWTFADAYWVYAAPDGSAETWLRVSDESWWLPGGTVPAPLPRLGPVQVAPSATGATLTWTTDVPASCWVDYDSYGSAEPYNSLRPAGWWPTYLHHTDLEAWGAPRQATSHSRTLAVLTPDATYHYRVACREPAPAVTADATFVAAPPPPPPPAPSPAHRCEIVVYLDGVEHRIDLCAPAVGG